MFKISRREMLVGASAMALQLPAFAGQEPHKGGTLIAVVQPEPTALTTVINSSFYHGIVSTNMFDALLTYDENFSPQPGLATSWDVSPDGLTITFKLRRGVKWHDAQPFTSADVKFNFLDVLRKYNARGRINLAPVESIDTPDDFTAIMHLSKPAPALMSALNSQDAQLLPRHLYEGTDIAKNPYNLKPVGTGAFRFKEWRRGEYISMVRNPDYWDQGKPYFDEIIFRIIPDAAARSAALETGEVMYAPYDAVAISDVPRLGKLPNLAISTDGYSYQGHMLMMELNTQRPQTSHPKVRQAISFAMDRQRLTDTVWYGLGTPAKGPIIHTSRFFSSEGVPQYPYDLKKANALLDEAGFPRKENGIRFTLSSSYMPFGETQQSTAQFIKQQLKQVGIDVTVENADLPTYLRRVYTNYDFDINQGSFATFIDPDLGLFRFYSTEQIAKGVAWSNASRYSNPTMDKLIAAQKSEPDEKKRLALMHQFQKMAQTDLPMVPLMEMHHFTTYNRKLHGLRKTPDAVLQGLKDAWLAS